jgi:Flp pilus assembly protein TadB
MTRDFVRILYVKICKFSIRLLASKRTEDASVNFRSNKWKKNYPYTGFENVRQTAFEKKLNKDLKFTQIDLKSHEVYAGAKLLAVLSLIILCLIDIGLIFPIFNFPIEVDNNNYNTLDKNEDGIQDLVQNLEPVWEIEYDSLGIEKNRYIIGYQGSINQFKIFLFIVCPTIIIPLITSVITLNYPRAAAKKLRLKSLASMPQTVVYISMSLRLNPSLETAVQFASDSIRGPMAVSLKKVLWDVYLRTHNTIESSFIAFAEEWGGFNESFKRAMYLLRSSVLERHPEGRRQVLDKANSVIIDGVKLEINNYANFLKVPTMFMFAFGIILPIIIATMLPIIGLGMESLLVIIIMMDVILPLVCFLYARKILATRPQLTFGDHMEMQPELSLNHLKHANRDHWYRQRKNLILLTFSVLFILCTLAGIIIFSGYIEDIEPHYGSLIIILSTAGFPAYFIYASIQTFRIRRKRFQQLEKEFPDALFQLGTRVAEGRPLETALEDTAKALKGSVISELFYTLVQHFRLTRKSIRKQFFKDDLNDIDLPGTIIASMKVVIEAVEKNSAGAGEIIIDISNYLRDLRTMDEIFKQKQKEILETIKQTGTIFAPLIIGLTTAMYFKLNSNLSDIKFEGSLGFGGFGLTDPIPGPIFVLIFGIYLLFTVIVIIYFVSGMESYNDRILFRSRLSLGLVTAGTIFVISCYIGFFLFGI